MTVPEIAEFFGVTYQTAYGWIRDTVGAEEIWRQRGFDPEARRHPPAEEAIRLNHAGLNRKEIAIKLEIDVAYVHKWLKNAGLYHLTKWQLAQWRAAPLVIRDGMAVLPDVPAAVPVPRRPALARQPRADPETMAMAVRLYHGGMSIAQVAEAMRVSYSKTARWLNCLDAPAPNDKWLLQQWRMYPLKLDVAGRVVLPEPLRLKIR